MTLQQVYQISGVCGVPANATAVALNVTLVGATTSLSLQAYPGDLQAPGTNVVSLAPPRNVVAGAAVLRLATNGSGTLGVLVTLDPPATSGQTNLVLDVSGYFAPAAPAPVVLAYHAYFPNGAEATSFAQDSERAKFTGHERDLGDPSSPADDLDYMHARHYSPLTGRFLSVDPASNLRLAMHGPQGWNRYAYVVGNPVKYIDPFGDVYTLGGCASGNAAECNKEKSILMSALGDSYSFVSIGGNGNVTLRVSAAAFSSHGTYERGLSDLIGSKAKFTFFALKNSGTESMGGASSVRLFW